MMTKHEVVMRYWGITAFYAAAFIPDTAGVAGGFEMDRDHWEDMGKPEVITVTVTPGGIGDTDEPA